MASHPYSGGQHPNAIYGQNQNSTYGQNTYSIYGQTPYSQSQYPQQPVGNGMYNIPQYAYPNIAQNIYPQQQQQQQQQQQPYYPFYQQQQQQQPQYQPNSNTFPLDAILFYDDDKPYYEFTNFAKIGFDLDGDYWPTSEHYFQAQKFEGYPKIQKEIRLFFGARDAFEFVRKPEIKSVNIILTFIENSGNPHNRHIEP